MQVEANGIRFVCIEQGRGPLVLCLHGYPDTPHTWDQLLPALAQAGFRAVAPWMRGYPPSSAPADGNYSGLALGEDVLGLIEALGETEADVVGHDWGAFAAYVAANLAPGKLRKLVTIGLPHPRTARPSWQVFWSLRHFFFYALPWLPERHLRADDWAGVEAICRRWSPDWNPAPGEFAAVKECFATGGLRNALGYYRSFMWWGWLPRGLRTTAVMRRRTRVPSLFVGGADDPALPASSLRDADSAYEAGYEVFFAPGGHFVHRESPAAVNQAILRFLA